MRRPVQVDAPTTVLACPRTRAAATRFAPRSRRAACTETCCAARRSPLAPRRRSGSRASRQRACSPYALPRATFVLGARASCRARGRSYQLADPPSARGVLRRGHEVTGFAHRGPLRREGRPIRLRASGARSRRWRQSRGLRLILDATRRRRSRSRASGEARSRRRTVGPAARRRPRRRALEAAYAWSTATARGLDWALVLAASAAQRASGAAAVEHARGWRECGRVAAAPPRRVSRGRRTRPMLDVCVSADRSLACCAPTAQQRGATAEDRGAKA